MLHPETLPLIRTFAKAGLETWLIGGQAIEVLCGGNVREHDDIDFMIRAEHGLQAVSILSGLGFVHAHGSLDSGDVFYRRGELLIDLVPVLSDPPRTLGDLSHIIWPAHFLTPYVVAWEGTPVQTLTPAMHRAMKEIVAQFYRAQMREKDRQDLAALATLST